MNENIEIIVVGGGPSGLIAARKAARKKTRVMVLEEDKSIGLPCHCAGLLSSKGLADIGVSPHEPFVQNKIKGARFFSPSRLSFTVERDETVAYVVDRSLFDQFLAQQAVKSGAQIKLSSKVQSIKLDKQRDAWTINIEKQGLLGAKMIVDAEGVSSRIVKSTGLKPLKLASILPALQFDLNNVNVDPDYVEIHTGSKIAPNFFAWVIPLGENSARAGLACKELNPRFQLEKFIKERFGEKNNMSQIGVRSGMIITSGPIEKTYSDNLLVVGDAAGQVKPTTGGGVILGGICASIAGDVAAEAVDKNNFKEIFLRKYEVLWKERLNKEFQMTSLARKVLNLLSDKAIDKLFKIIIEENLQDELSVDGNMDFQRNALLKLLKRKEVLKILPTVWRALTPFK
ncbi:MAG: NAD(P)/FAD-dependent oxidoreductase [Candidatus Bathyarchaeia archaeon]